MSLKKMQKGCRHTIYSHIRVTTGDSTNNRAFSSVHVRL